MDLGCNIYNNMDLGFFTNQQLFDYFCKNKTKISTIRDPAMLLRHLKDNKVITTAQERDHDPENSDESVYMLLECIEKRGRIHVRRFWDCVNKEHILERYPQIFELIQTLKNELPGCSAGSHDVSEDRLDTSEGRETREEPRTRFTETQRNSLDSDSRPYFWNMPEHEIWLPVQCGEIEGLLDRHRLYRKEEKCIKIEDQLITPFQFEEMGGKGSRKNWKRSILCQGIPLKTLIERDIVEVSDHKGKLVLHK